MTLKKSADMIIRTCMGAKSGESVLMLRVDYSLPSCIAAVKSSPHYYIIM